MKKLTLLLMFAVTMLACNDKNESKESSNQDEAVIEQTQKKEDQHENDNQENLTTKFDINNIPLSNKNIGDFPFFSAPDGAMYINNVNPIDFDFVVVVTPNDIFEVEGRTFRAYVHQDSDSKKIISSRYLFKSYEDAILEAGGVKVFEGKLEDDREKKYKELCTYAGSDGSINIYSEPIATYVIRRDDGNVYIAMEKHTSSSPTTAIQIVQEKAFKQTIKMIKSDEIQKDLIEKGKSVLNINFDTDKATLKPDGLDAVQEIITVLKNNPDLKISINGYTDNSGRKEHNQKLSEERALTAKDEIIKAGINRKRLASNGFGQDNHIADNSTAEGQAKNRRVELVKQ